MLRKIIGGFFIALPFIGLFVFISYKEGIKVGLEVSLFIGLIIVISIACAIVMVKVIRFLNLLRRKK